MSSQNLRWEIEGLSQSADGLVSAGVGLERIGLMLNEGELSADERNGLEQAVRALGDYVRRTGIELYAQAAKMKGGEQ